MSTSATSLLVLHLVAEGLPNPEHEFRFHPKRLWRFDMAWPNSDTYMILHEDEGAGIAVEIDGGAFMRKSRHTTGTGFSKDLEKLNAATELGGRIFRYTPAMVKSGEAIRQLKRVLERTA